MAKTVYDYTSVSIPVDAKNKVIEIYKKRLAKGEKVRMADLWIEAVSKLKG